MGISAFVTEPSPRVWKTSLATLEWTKAMVHMLQGSTLRSTVMSFRKY